MGSEAAILTMRIEREIIGRFGLCYENGNEDEIRREGRLVGLCGSEQCQCQCVMKIWIYGYRLVFMWMSSRSISTLSCSCSCSCMYILNFVPSPP